MEDTLELLEMTKKELTLKIQEMQLKIITTINKINQKKAIIQEHQTNIDNVIKQQSKACLVYQSKEQEIAKYSEQFSVGNHLNQTMPNDYRNNIERLTKEIEQIQSEIAINEQIIDNLIIIG